MEPNILSVNKYKENDLVLLGNGWGGASALKGLKKEFNTILFVSEDSELIRLGGEQNRIGNIDNFENKLVICAGYKPIIPLRLLEKNTFINIHYSLLPKYRGLHSTVWAILNNEPYLGFSIHLMNKFIDDGDVIYQFKTPNDFTTTATEYMKFFNDVISKTLGSTIKDFINGKVELIKQDKSKATWVGKRSYKDCLIDFSKTSTYLKAFFRALTPPYPIPYFYHKDKIIKVKNYRFHDANCETHLGRVLNIDQEGIWIKIEDGYIVLSNLYDEKGKHYSISNFRIGQYLNQ